MDVSAILTSHANEPGLRSMLGNLRYQTRPPEETLVFASGYEWSVLQKIKEDFGVAVYNEPDSKDWGHAKRAKGIQLATKEWLGFFNDDDRYEDSYLERMLAFPETDVVYCEWSGVPVCSFGMGSSTAGNYLVRSEIARRAGYSERDYSADGHFIEAIKKLTTKVARVDDCLYFHNEGPQLKGRKEP